MSVAVAFGAKRTLTRCACCQTRRQRWAKQIPGGRAGTPGDRRRWAASRAGKGVVQPRAVGRYCGHRTDWAALAADMVKRGEDPGRVSGAGGR